MHIAVVGFRFGGEAEPRFGLGRTEEPSGGVAADLRAMLEPVAGTAADQQDVRQARVEIDQEIAV